MAHKIIGTAGHIDHGKTALIKALTGTETDRLKEEKEREITIDLGFAFLDENIAFIDVPGHERFVKNMVAGVTGIDLAMLVIAADDGIMPQTKEHLDILRLLDIQKIVVALTKTDIVESDWTALVTEDINDLMEINGYENAPVIPVSSKTNEGIDNLKSILIREIEGVRERQLDRPFRLPIDRSFTMTGFGTVITGTVTAGSVKIDDNISLYPRQIQARIRGLQTQGRQTERLSAGERGAINISGLQKHEIFRGDVLAHAGTLAPSDNVNCIMTYLKSAESPLPYHARIRFHCGTAEVLGRVAILDRENIEPGDSAPVQIQLEKPVAAAIGDRFIIRQYSPPFTIGGGEIMETTAARPRKNRKTIAEYTTGFAPLDLPERVICRVERAGINPVSTHDLTREFSLFPERIKSLLINAGDKVMCVSEEENLWISSRVFAEFASQTREKITGFHKNNPSIPGMKRSDLVRKSGLKATEPVWKAVLDTLEAQRKIILSKDRLKLSDFKPKVSPEAEQLRNRLLRLLEEKGINAPSIRETAAEFDVSQEEINEVVDILKDEDKILVIEGKLLYSTDEINKIREILISWFKKNNTITLADFRTILSTSRKYALPLLNFFDDTGVTVRVGDERVLK